MASTPGFEPGSLWWEISTLTTVPPLLLTDTKQMVDFVTTKSRQDYKCPGGGGGGGCARLELTLSIIHKYWHLFNIPPYSPITTV